ncbi:hypothetical protein [Alkalihalobacillus hemicellulosilyticus]|nr:hypothetical protein [Halalkalibacter hemicellulosilyticus]
MYTVVSFDPKEIALVYVIIMGACLLALPFFMAILTMVKGRKQT